AGFVLKEHLRKKLVQDGHEVVDFGTNSAESCDYPDFAQSVARDVAMGRCDRGILCCGTGIGMAIVYRIVEDHGGRLRAESTPGGGTTITVELPAAGPGEPLRRHHHELAGAGALPAPATPPAPAPAAHPVHPVEIAG
ncbi:MAG TPA: RpiB/LacA/LacB family sugar-phosphate isomerase, partial [Thermoanaerobaculia bacterium]|nr:RpiB/LacA/LacB family sugar-phosphate isomerase [Thermoanaerobaculia bacterium]